MAIFSRLVPKSRGGKVAGFTATTLVAGSVGIWATITTMNDDWDEYSFGRPSPSATQKQPLTPNEKERIVILGSGWGGLNALMKCKGSNKDIVVVSPRPHFLYTPLLAGSAVGSISLRSACEPIRNLISSAANDSSSTTYVRADARYVDVTNKRVYANTGDDTNTDLELSYDKLLIAVGSQPNTFGIPGVKEHGLFMKEAEDSARLQAKLLSNLEKASAIMKINGEDDDSGYGAEIDRLLTVMIVGAGPTGVELSAEMADFRLNDVKELFGEAISKRMKIVLVEAIPRILGPFDPKLAATARKHLESRGVEVRTCTAVTRVNDPSTVTLAPSTPRTATEQQKQDALAQAKEEKVGAFVWCAGVGPRPFVQKLAESLKSVGQNDRRGLKVDECMRVEGIADHSVYAIGDAAITPFGLPPTAQVATQEGKHVGRQFRDSIDTPFKYSHKGTLCTLGAGNGLAQLVAPKGTHGSSINIWDVIGAEHLGTKDNEQIGITGLPAFAMWRSLYWTQLLSNNTRIGLSLDWFKTIIRGRDVTEPVLKRQPTLQQPNGTHRKVETFGTPLRRNPTVRIVGADPYGNKKGISANNKEAEAVAPRKKFLGLF